MARHRLTAANLDGKPPGTRHQTGRLVRVHPVARAAAALGPPALRPRGHHHRGVGADPRRHDGRL